MHRHRRRALVALGVSLSLVGAAACSRSDDGSTDSGTGTTTDSGTGTTSAAANRLDAGTFGDLEGLCSPGEPGAPTVDEPGLSAEAIQIGVVTDKGFTVRQGLNEEMFDAANAFAGWCNSHGGINGRLVRIADRDAAYSQYDAAVTDACAEDFALVGGGAVLDNSDNGRREECGLPNLPGYVVSATAREAGLQVQAVPNPLHTLMAGHYQALAAAEPDLIAHYGIMSSPIESIALVAETSRQAALAAGFVVAADLEYNAAVALDSPTARGFVDQLNSAGVEILEFIGEPTNLTVLQEAIATVGDGPQIIIEPPNFYDQLYLDSAGENAVGTLVRTQFTPFELADSNPATADYLELMDRYGVDEPKSALLGMQALSAILLFAQSAAACGEEISRACLLEEAGSVTEWTGGGMHTAQDPSTAAPSPCFTILAITADGYVVDEALTAPTDGIFNCEADNIVDVELPG